MKEIAKIRGKSSHMKHKKMMKQVKPQLAQIDTTKLNKNSKKDKDDGNKDPHRRTKEDLHEHILNNTLGSKGDTIKTRASKEGRTKDLAAKKNHSHTRGVIEEKDIYIRKMAKKTKTSQALQLPVQFADRVAQMQEIKDNTLTQETLDQLMSKRESKTKVTTTRCKQ